MSEYMHSILNVEFLTGKCIMGCPDNVIKRKIVSISIIDFIQTDTCYRAITFFNRNFDLVVKIGTANDVNNLMLQEVITCAVFSLDFFVFSKDPV